MIVWFSFQTNATKLHNYVHSNNISAILIAWKQTKNTKEAKSPTLNDRTITSALSLCSHNHDGTTEFWITTNTTFWEHGIMNCSRYADIQLYLSPVVLHVMAACIMIHVYASKVVFIENFYFLNIPHKAISLTENVKKRYT